MNLRHALVLALLNALLSASFLIVYARWFSPSSPPRLAVLDVGELYRLKESQVTSVLIKHSSTDAERLAALQRAQAFGADVSAMIQSLPKECRCLILARGALVGDDDLIPDLTPEVRRRLGL